MSKAEDPSLYISKIYGVYITKLGLKPSKYIYNRYTYPMTSTPVAPDVYHDRKPRFCETPKSRTHALGTPTTCRCMASGRSST
jgi:hypothetical protein